MKAITKAIIIAAIIIIGLCIIAEPEGPMTMDIALVKIGLIGVEAILAMILDNITK